MPSSLVFTALVVAWLAVLVPVVARRRQLVPRPAEADLCSRVLARPGGAPVKEEVVVSERVTNGRSVRSGGGAAVADRDAPEVEAPETETRVGGPDRTAGELTGVDEAALDRELELATRDEDRPEVDDPDGLDRPELDGDDLEGEHDDDVAGRFDDEHDEHDEVRAARPFRPGRGGFDPEAAAAAAEARYAFRQRVALALIAVAVVAALGALVISSTLWWVHLGADVALVGYLVYLRRQTRIEEEVRERRLARLSGERRAREARRERQAEHEARLDALDEEAWGLDEDLADDGSDEPRWVAPRTPAPAVPVGMELVEDSEDDPAFHDLDGDRVPAYRRTVGV